MYVKARSSELGISVPIIKVRRSPAGVLKTKSYELFSNFISNNDNQDYIPDNPAVIVGGNLEDTPRFISDDIWSCKSSAFGSYSRGPAYFNLEKVINTQQLHTRH